MPHSKKKNKTYPTPKTDAELLREQLLLSETYLKKSGISNQQNVIVYIGDVRKAIKRLPNNSIDCVVTSPPYWLQRDYKHPEQIGQENSYEEYISNLVNIFTEMKRVLKSTGTFFLNIGYKYYNKQLLLIPEMIAACLQKSGWTLINKIIWHKPNAMPSSIETRFSNVYEPIFLFVKEESKYNYYLSIDELRLPILNFSIEKKIEDLLGLEVVNPMPKDKRRGEVVKVYKNSRNNILVEVEWEDKKKTLEIVQHFNQESQIPVELLCQECGKSIKNIFDIHNHSDCRGFPKPILQSEPDFSNKIEVMPHSLFQCLSTKKSYSGKFKLSPDNRGASPGARKSLYGEYLVVQRRYEVFQPLIADYLRYWREKRDIPIKEIDKFLGYRDTAGHWFRKDTGSWGKGGSIPLPDDWFKLKEILKFDDLYDRWVTGTHLVLQTVKPHPKGKNPGDVWSIKLQPLSEAHFATFPEELVRRCILAGCPPGGIVLDPFAGSGTTGKVARDLGRNGILIELVPDYLEIIKKRCDRKHPSDLDTGAERIFHHLFASILHIPNSSPIGSDLMFEVYDAFIHIEIKTALIDNPADYKGKINVALNQTSYKVNKIFTPNLPYYYNPEGDNKKPCLTYIIQIIHEHAKPNIKALKLVCLPNGQLFSHYGKGIVKSGKGGYEKAKDFRFHYSTEPYFKLLSEQYNKKIFRVELVFLAKDLDAKNITGLSDVPIHFQF